MGKVRRGFASSVSARVLNGLCACPPLIPPLMHWRTSSDESVILCRGVIANGGQLTGRAVDLSSPTGHLRRCFCLFEKRHTCEVPLQSSASWHVDGDT